MEGVTLILGVAEIDMEGVTLGVDDIDIEGVLLTDGVILSEMDGVALGVADTDVEGVVLTDGVTLIEMDGVTDGVTAKEDVTDGVTLGDGKTVKHSNILNSSQSFASINVTITDGAELKIAGKVYNCGNDKALAMVPKKLELLPNASETYTSTGYVPVIFVISICAAIS